MLEQARVYFLAASQSEEDRWAVASPRLPLRLLSPPDGLPCHAQRAPHLDGESDIGVGTEAPSPVAGAMVEAATWETENPPAQCR